MSKGVISNEKLLNKAAEAYSDWSYESAEGSGDAKKLHTMQNKWEKLKTQVLKRMVAPKRKESMIYER